MEKWTEIRREVLTGAISKRAAMARYRIGWRTLKKMLAHDEPPGYQRAERRPKPKLQAFLPVIRQILETDPANLQSRFGLAQTLESLERYYEADEIYQDIIKSIGHSDVGSFAKEGRTRIAHVLLRRVGGERPDVVMYCLGALERFQDMAQEEVAGIGREIAILGMKGLDINDPATKYTLQSLPGDFSGLHLVSLMYAAFQKTSPGTDVGIDLSKEYAQAVAMFGEK